MLSKASHGRISSQRSCIGFLLYLYRNGDGRFQLADLSHAQCIDGQVETVTRLTVLIAFQDTEPTMISVLNMIGLNS